MHFAGFAVFLYRRGKHPAESHEEVSKVKTNKVIISVIAVILLIAAGGIYLKFSLGENLRSLGFPSLNTVPAGFSFVNEKAIDTGDW